MTENQTNGWRDVPRAEVVGSLLRPPALRAAFEQTFEDGRTHAATVLDAAGRQKLLHLNVEAEAAIGEAVSRQIAAGIDVITDGEMRRAHFTNSLVDALAGVAAGSAEFAFTSSDGASEVPPPDPIIRERLSLIDNPAEREVRFVRSLTHHPVKVSVPAPSYWYHPSAQFDEVAYPDRDQFVAHMVELSRVLLAGALDAGARYVQVDFPVYPMLADDEKRDQLLARLGESEESLLAKALAADNAVLEGLPADVTAAMHICRGNFRSQWWLSGSLERVAEPIFTQLRYDRFLVEWEDIARQGDFTSLRFLPDGGPIVVMGLVSSKVAHVESADDIVRQLDQASAIVDIDQLAISPQCGFASVWKGNDVTEEVQWRKLDLVGRVADRVWPR